MKVIAQNKKARFNYTIEKTYEVGIVLQGSEVKSIRLNGANINESFAKIIKEELFLINAHIAPYARSSYFNHDSTRSRKLLMHKKELSRLFGKVKEKGISLVPLKLYFNEKSLLKLEIGLAKGKKLYDKRKDLKEKDLNEKINREVKYSR